MTTIKNYLHSFEAYVNGEYGDIEKKAFENKLEQDSVMRAAWDEYRLMMDAFADKEAIRLRLMLNETFHNKWQNQKIKTLTTNLWFRLSAAAVIIIIMGSLLYFFCSSDLPSDHFTKDPILAAGDTTVLVQNNHSYDSIAPPVMQADDRPDPVQLASVFDEEAYQISPVFAELLHNVYRSTWFRLKTPVDSVFFSEGDSLVFSWETNINEPLYFDILDRNGQVVYRQPDIVTSPTSHAPDLDPAIYMYRFATKDQPVWVGVMVRIQ